MSHRFQVRSVQRRDAETICSWRYEPPYQIYEMGSDPELLLDAKNGYWAVDEADAGEGGHGVAWVLAGYCCFGAEGRVPGYDYSALEALDVGAGLAPERTGGGRGAAFLRAIVAFADELHQPDWYRATVATFNQRSLRACRSIGFAERARFTSTGASARTFAVLLMSAGRLAAEDQGA